MFLVPQNPEAETLVVHEHAPIEYISIDALFDESPDVVQPASAEVVGLVLDPVPEPVAAVPDIAAEHAEMAEVIREVLMFVQASEKKLQTKLVALRACLGRWG